MTSRFPNIFRGSLPTDIPHPHTDNNGPVKVSHYGLYFYSHVNVAIVTIPAIVTYY